MAATTVKETERLALEAPFDCYHLDTCYDEMFAPDGKVRRAYRQLHKRLVDAEPGELYQKKQTADNYFLHQGITFTVYSEAENIERIFPYDLLPRIITAQEWSKIEAGLTQRITALNLFLHDIYHKGRILSDRVVPHELVYSSKHYRREMRDVSIPRDVYVALVGTDLDPDCRAVSSPCWKTICACPAEHPTCWATGG